MGTDNLQTFQDISKGVVERFLQTVVVLDDGAYMEPDNGQTNIDEPDENASIPENDSEEDGEMISSPAAGINTLDAQTLIAGFAKQGLVCAVLAPRVDELDEDVIVKTSRRADIVILDWQLGDHGERATKIIHKIVAEDASAGGRIRMIVIYTASLDLVSVRDAVSEKLPEYESIDRPGKVLALSTQQSRILFISKGRTSEFSGKIEESQLPIRLVEEFVEITKGILPNVTLGSIAAIREETHRMLARFHRDLDPAYLTHRMLLLSPDDAEAYAVDLLTSEFIATLQENKIGSMYAGKSAIEAALNEHVNDGCKFQIMVKKNSVENAMTILVEDLMKLIDQGPEGLADIPKMPTSKSHQEKLHERLYLVFSNKICQGLASHREFSRVCAHARERSLMKENFQARLDLGTIVRLGDEFLVCVQPTCDTLRLQGETQFLFAFLSKNEAQFDLMVQDLDGDEAPLKLNAKASSLKAMVFEPDRSTGTVISTTVKEGGVFESTSGEQIAWLCDLRISFAQRFVHRIATDLSRIGLAEFEWQRRHAPTYSS